MHLDLHEDVRAWKGYPWDVLDLLFEQGLITDPSKAKSVALSDEGVRRSAECFANLLATKTVSPAPSDVLFESRPSFLQRSQWQEQPVAKFKFNKTRATWQLYCMFRDLKWHRYEPFPESPDIAALVAEVREDPTGIFWG
jgi:Protein of unknown function (DUF3024)/Domain of unknown function (DUF6429)